MNTRPRPRSDLRRAAAMAGASLLLFACGGGGSDELTRLPLSVGAGNSATAEADAAGAMAAPMPADDMMGLYRPVDYVAGPDLPELGGDRTVYRIERGSDDALRAVADALGLDGEISTDDGIRRITAGDGALESYDGSFWNWYDGEGRDVGIAVACSPEGVCDEPPPPERPADLPTQQEAEAIARDLLSVSGPSLEGATVTVDDGLTTWYVNVEYQVGGMAASGLQAYVSVGSGGHVASASGPLGDVVEVGDYPTISARDAIRRLTEGFGPMPLAVDTVMGAPEPAIAEGPPTEDSMTGDDTATEPAPPEQVADPGDQVEPDEPDTMPVDEPMQEPEPVTVTVLDAEWALTSFWSWDDSGIYLLPAYRYTTDDGGQPIVPAVTDDVIAPPPSDSEQPDPATRTDVVDEGGGVDGQTSPGSPGPADETDPAAGDDSDQVNQVEPAPAPEPAADPEG